MPGSMRQAKVASDPDTLVAFFKQLGLPVVRIGLEAGPLSQWLYAGLAQAGFETVLLETPHVKAALSAMTVKTDRKDARGIEISDWKSRTRSNVYSIKWISIAPIWRASKRPCGCLIRTSSPKHSNRHHRAGATTGFVRANVVGASMTSCVMQRAGDDARDRQRHDDGKEIAGRRCTHTRIDSQNRARFVEPGDRYDRTRRGGGERGLAGDLGGCRPLPITAKID